MQKCSKFLKNLAILLSVAVAVAALSHQTQANVILINAGGNVTPYNFHMDYVSPPTYQDSNASDGVTGGGNLYVSISNYKTAYDGVVALTLDLGSDKSIDSAAFWNYPLNGNGVSSFSLKFATAADGTSGLGAGNPGGTSIAYNPTFAPANSGPSTEQDFAFGQTVTARYVQIKLLNNYAGDRVGFSELQLGQAVPEPASLGMGLLGLGLLLVRKRRIRG